MLGRVAKIVRFTFVEQENRTGSGVINAAIKSHRAVTFEHNHYFAMRVLMRMVYQPESMAWIPGIGLGAPFEATDPDPAFWSGQNFRSGHNGITAKRACSWHIPGHDKLNNGVRRSQVPQGDYAANRFRSTGLSRVM